MRKVLSSSKTLKEKGKSTEESGVTLPETPPPPEPAPELICEFCNDKFSTPAALGSHKQIHKDEIEKRRKEATLEVQGGDVEDRRNVINFGPSALAGIKKKVLSESIKNAPGGVPKLHDWVMMRWDRSKVMQEDERELYDVLRNAGIPDRISNDIVGDVFSVEQEFAAELRMYYEGPSSLQYRRRRGEEVVGPSVRYGGPVRRRYGYGPPSYYQEEDEYYYGQPRYGRGGSSELSTIMLLKELGLLKTGGETDSSGTKGGQTGSDPVVEIVSPLRDSDGKILTDQKGSPIYTTIRGPASQVQSRFVSSPSSGSELSTIKTLKELGLVRIPGTEQRIDVEEVIAKATEPYVQKIGELEQKMETLKEEGQKRERERLEREVAETKKDMKDLETRLRSEISGRSGEYKEDSYRLVGTGLNRIADIAERKSPGERLITAVFGPGEGGAVPARTAERGARHGLISELERAGYVVQE